MRINVGSSQCIAVKEAGGVLRAARDSDVDAGIMGEGASFAGYARDCRRAVHHRAASHERTGPVPKGASAIAKIVTTWFQAGPIKSMNCNSKTGRLPWRRAAGDALIVDSRERVENRFGNSVEFLVSRKTPPFGSSTSLEK